MILTVSFLNFFHTFTFLLPPSPPLLHRSLFFSLSFLRHFLFHSLYSSHFSLILSSLFLSPLIVLLVSCSRIQPKPIVRADSRIFPSLKVMMTPKTHEVTLPTRQKLKVIKREKRPTGISATVIKVSLFQPFFIFLLN